MTPDPLATLLAALTASVRSAAREGAEEALRAARVTDPALPAPLIDKKEIARALGISTAKVDRLCRDQRIPFVRVGDVRRFDLAAVRASIEAEDDRAAQRHDVQPAGRTPSRIAGVRLLSRRPRQAGG